MSKFLESFTFDRNTYRRTAEESADSVALHIEKVNRTEQLDKTASNIVGALASYMGVFTKNNGAYAPTKVASVFIELYAANKADSWRWLVARSLWKYVVPNGTACKANVPASAMGVTFAFFHVILQLLTHLSTESGKKRFLYFEELCNILSDDANWGKSGSLLFNEVIKGRISGHGGFGSRRSFLEDLENKSDTERSEYGIPRDNFNGLFLKAFAQTGFIDFKDGPDGKMVALALSPNLDVVLQRRLRFILDHPPIWDGSNWPGYMDIQAEDLPKEVSMDSTAPQSDSLYSSVGLQNLIVSAKADCDSSQISTTEEQLRRLVAALQTKRLLILTGLSGSGKTILADAFARWITPVCMKTDPLASGVTIESERISYYINASDQIAVEFWNSTDEATATKVTLPRAIIEEWAKYIKENELAKDTPARTIREGVKVASKFSDQLHSFETHLKAAAYALLDSGFSKQFARCRELVAVGADWTSNENLLGYPDALKSNSYRKPDNGALDLILRAKSDPINPYFLILDEMNLSHVERYFADFLSAMESGAEISLHAGDKNEIWDGVPGKLRIPSNLFVIGTVNVDETTYMFSPKVLDRANVIEFRVSREEMGGFLANPTKPNLDWIAGRGVKYAEAFAAAAAAQDVVLDIAIREAVAKVLMEFFPSLKEVGAEFGYRTAHEVCRFVHFHKELSGGDWKLEVAMDSAIMQKLLPKLHGSKKKLERVLATLQGLCVGKYPVSVEKIERMQKRLAEHGFTSFAEA